VFREDGCTAASGPTAHAGDDEDRVNLVGRDVVEDVLDLVDISLGDCRTEFVVRTHAVTFDSSLADEHTVLPWNVVEAEQVRLRGVDSDRRANDAAVRPVVVLEESIDDLATGLPESDHRQFHWVSEGSVGSVGVRSTV
jgi:hypothetical protein